MLKNTFVDTEDSCSESNESSLSIKTNASLPNVSVRLEKLNGLNASQPINFTSQQLIRFRHSQYIHPESEDLLDASDAESHQSLVTSNRQDMPSSSPPKKKTKNQVQEKSISYEHKNSSDKSSAIKDPSNETENIIPSLQNIFPISTNKRNETVVSANVNSNNTGESVNGIGLNEKNAYLEDEVHTQQNQNNAHQNELIVNNINGHANDGTRDGNAPEHFIDDGQNEQNGLEIQEDQVIDELGIGNGQIEDIIQVEGPIDQDHSERENEDGNNQNNQNDRRKRKTMNMKQFILTCMNYYKATEDHGFEERQRRYTIENDELYLGENKTVQVLEWELLNLERPAIFLVQTALLLWDTHEFANRAFEIHDDMKNIPGRSPIKLVEKNLLRLLISLYHDYLKRNKCLDHDSRASYLLKTTYSLRNKMRSLRSQEKKAQTPRNARNARRRLSYNSVE